MVIKAGPPAAGLSRTTAVAAKEEAKLKAACVDMEAVFLNMLLGEMRKSVPKTGLTGGGKQEEIMQSLLDGEMTKNMSKAGGIGLADVLYRQLSPTVNKIANKGQAPE